MADIRDKSGNVVYRLEGDRIYDIYGNWKYEKRGEYIFDTSGNRKYEIRGEYIFNTSGNRLGERKDLAEILGSSGDVISPGAPPTPPPDGCLGMIFVVLIKVFRFFINFQQPFFHHDFLGFF